jgi:hypothetical protein
MTLGDAEGYPVDCGARRGRAPHFPRGEVMKIEILTPAPADALGRPEYKSLMRFAMDIEGVVFFGCLLILDVTGSYDVIFSSQTRDVTVKSEMREEMIRIVSNYYIEKFIRDPIKVQKLNNTVGFRKRNANRFVQSKRLAVE